MDGMNKEKWKAFSGKEKAEHIWYYYKVHIIVTLLIVICAVGMIYTAVTKVEPQMTVLMFNTTNIDAMAAPPDYSAFMTEYGYENYDGAVKTVKNYYIFSKEEDPELYNTNYYNDSKAVIDLMYAGAVDVIFGRGDFFEKDMLSSEVFVDLRTILPAEVLEAYKDNIIYGRVLPENEDEESTEVYPCAIYLKDNAWVKASGLYSDCYVAIPKSQSTKEIAVDFLLYLLQQ